MLLIAKSTNRLGFPFGVKPAIDPTHPAAQGLRFSGVATAGNFLNLAANCPLVGTVAGTPSARVLGSLNSGVKFTSSTDAIKFVPPVAQTFSANMTSAAIFQYDSAITTSQSIFCSSDGSGNATFILYAGQGGASDISIFFNPSGVATSLAVVVGVPYFCAYSQNSSTGNVILTRLDTGSTTTASITAGAPGIIDALYFVGNNPFNQPMLGTVVAAMYSATTLSTARLRQWAANPWAFWYPQKLSVQDLLASVASKAPTWDFEPYSAQKVVWQQHRRGAGGSPR